MEKWIESLSRPGAKETEERHARLGAVVAARAATDLARNDEWCVGYLAHPFVKWMVLLLIASFFVPLSFFTDEGVQDHFAYLQAFAKAIFYLRGGGRETGCFKHSKNNTVALSTHSPQVVLNRPFAHANIQLEHFSSDPFSPPKVDCCLPSP